jgi:hypothetical protein
MAAADLEVDRNLKAASGSRSGLLTLAIKDIPVFGRVIWGHALSGDKPTTQCSRT